MLIEKIHSLDEWNDYPEILNPFRGLEFLANISFIEQLFYRKE